MVSGIERFRIVSSIFKQNMYSGIYEDIDPDWTPINLFERDPERLEKYKILLKFRNIPFDADLFTWNSD